MIATDPEVDLAEVIIKRFEDPDKVTEFEKGRHETVTLGGMTVGRATYQPSWRLSKDVGPGIGTEYCTLEHVRLVISGAATAAFSDGTVTELKAGDLFYVSPQPHYSCVFGNEPYVSLHFLGASTDARQEQ